MGYAGSMQNCKSTIVVDKPFNINFGHKPFNINFERPHEAEETKPFTKFEWLAKRIGQK